MRISFSSLLKTGLTVLSVTALVAPSVSFASEWIELSPSTLDGSYYRAVSAVEDTVVAFGSYGSITSTDGGNTWNNEVAYDTGSADYVSMQTGMAFSDRAVAAGGNGVISLSTDSGASWLSVTSPVSYDLYALDGKYAAANAAYTLFAAGSMGTVAKSSNGGETWSNVSVGSSETLVAVGVASKDIAWVAGENGTLYKTEDGGSSWVMQDLSTSFDINTLSVIDSNTVWVAGEGEYMSMTTNGGSTWTEVYPTDRDLNGEILSLVFISESEAYMARTDRCIWHTTDTGATWSSRNSHCGIEYSRLTVSSNDQLYAVGMGSAKVLSAYDNEAPTVSTVSTNSNPTAGETSTLTITATDNYTIDHCVAKSSETSLGTFTQQGESSTFTFSYVFPTGGDKVLTATCTDTASNVTTGSSVTVSVVAGTHTASAGDLVKTACSEGHDVNDPCTAVYYLGSDGYRHAFTNEKVFFSWYTDFNDVITIDSATMSSYTIGDNVTYKPGVTLVKFLTVRTVYAVEQGGILHGIESEELAAALYGSDWNTQDVDDISDAFYRDYVIGTTIDSTSDYNVSDALASTSTIDENF